MFKRTFYFEKSYMKKTNLKVLDSIKNTKMNICKRCNLNCFNSERLKQHEEKCIRKIPIKPRLPLANSKYATVTFKPGTKEYDLKEILEYFPEEQHQEIKQCIQDEFGIDLLKCKSLGVAGYMALVKSIGKIDLMTDKYTKEFDFMLNAYHGGYTCLNRFKSVAKATEIGMTIDCNSLYPYAACFPMPIDSYKFTDPNEWDSQRIMQISLYGETGYYFDVAYTIPEDVKNYIDDYPITRSRENIADVIDRTNYVDHYYNIQMMILSGYKITKINKVLQFRQKPIMQEFFLKCYNLRNKYPRIQSAIKLLMNSIYGLLIVKPENITKITVNTDKEFYQHAYDMTLIKSVEYNTDGSVTLEKINPLCFYQSPFHWGITLLSISRRVMSNFYYKNLKPLNNFRLLATRTDSFKFIADKNDIEEKLLPVLSKELGKFKQEGQMFTYFIANNTLRVAYEYDEELEELIDRHIKGLTTKTENRRYFANTTCKRAFNGLQSRALHFYQFDYRI